MHVCIYRVLLNFGAVYIGVCRGFIIEIQALPSYDADDRHVVGFRTSRLFMKSGMEVFICIIEQFEGAQLIIVANFNSRLNRFI